MKVSMLGKMGDLVYSLPVIKALARQHGKIHLVTSALCFQLVPLLEEQPYIQEVEMYTGPVELGNDGCFKQWALLGPEGINLSPQPAMYRPRSPVPWTLAYAELAGVKELALRDYIAFPTLWNHRQWYWEHDVTQGQKKWFPPKTAILAPESETLKTINLDYWRKVAKELSREFTVLVVGVHADDWFDRMENVKDLRGLTTVSSMARLMAEAYVCITANSLPWHIARHTGCPTFCFQDQYIDRCTPVDTPFRQYKAADWKLMSEDALFLASQPATTLWNEQKLRELAA